MKHTRIKGKRKVRTHRAYEINVLQLPSDKSTCVQYIVFTGTISLISIIELTVLSFVTMRMQYLLSFIELNEEMKTLEILSSFGLVFSLRTHQIN